MDGSEAFAMSHQDNVLTDHMSLLLARGAADEAGSSTVCQRRRGSDKKTPSPPCSSFPSSLKNVFPYNIYLASPQKAMLSGITFKLLRQS
jgi:hypothetical protein